jgi:predicted SAM-dependent methyltransferase
MMTLGQSLNRVLLPLHVRVERLPNDVYDLALYPETVKPAVPRYLNVGSLDFPHPLWHKLDNPTDMEEFSRKQHGNIDIAHDLMSGAPLPIADNCLAIAYCSHVIEHLRDADVRGLFREIHRTLAPGGTFRVVAPDARLFHDAYLRGDIHHFRNAVGLYPAPSIEQKLLLQVASSLVQHHPAQGHRKLTDDEIRASVHSMKMEDCFEHFKAMIPMEVQKQHPADHVNWFSVEKVLGMLTEAGFRNAAPSAYLQSHLPVLRNKYLFDPHADHSWFVECTKES